MKIIEDKDGVVSVHDESSTVYDRADLESDAFYKMLHELHGRDDVEISIHRQSEHGGKRLKYEFACSPDDYSYTELLEKIQVECGEGSYRIHLRKGNLLCGNKGISVGKPKSKPGEAKTATLESSLSSLMEKMVERQDAFMQRILTAAEERKPNQMELMQQLAMLKEVMGPSPASVQQQSPIDMLRLFLEMKDSFIPKQTSPLDLLKTVIEIQASISGGDKDANGNDVLISLINNVLPKLGEMGMGKPAQQETGVVNAIENKSEKKPENSTTEDKRHPMWAQLMYLVGMAKNGRDPVVYANVILDQTPDARIEELYKFASRPDAVQEMIKICSAVSHHKEWFAELASAICAELDDPGEPTLNVGEKRSTEVPQQDIVEKMKKDLTAQGAVVRLSPKATEVKKAKNKTNAGGSGTN